MIQFDPSISLGNLVQIVVLIGGLFIGYTKFVKRLTVFEMRLQILWAQWKKDHGVNGGLDDTRYGG